MAAYQRELIETHYQEVDNMYRQMRGWRHDYRNHIQTMKAYAATEDWDAIRHYLDLLDKDPYHSRYCGKNRKCHDRCYFKF